MGIDPVFYHLKFIPVPMQLECPREIAVFIFESHNLLDTVRCLSLPCQVHDASVCKFQSPAIARPDCITKQSKRAEYRAISHGVGANEHIETAQVNTLLGQIVCTMMVPSAESLQIRLIFPHERPRENGSLS